MPRGRYPLQDYSRMPAGLTREQRRGVLNRSVVHANTRDIPNECEVCAVEGERIGLHLADSVPRVRLQWHHPRPDECPLHLARVCAPCHRAIHAGVLAQPIGRILPQTRAPEVVLLDATGVGAPRQAV